MGGGVEGPRQSSCEKVKRVRKMGRTAPQNDKSNSRHDKIERDIKKEKKKTPQIREQEI